MSKASSGSRRSGCLVLEAVSGVQCHCVCLPLYQALNHEQGMEWIKAERLPCFRSC